MTSDIRYLTDDKWKLNNSDNNIISLKLFFSENFWGKTLHSYRHEYK